MKYLCNTILVLATIILSHSLVAEEIRLNWSNQLSTSLLLADSETPAVGVCDQCIVNDKGELLLSLRRPTRAPSASVEILSAQYAPYRSATLEETVRHAESEILRSSLGFQQKQAQLTFEMKPFRVNHETGMLERLIHLSFQINNLEDSQTIQHRSASSFTDVSKLSSGTWYKLAVESEGMFKIDHNYLSDILGLNPAQFKMSEMGVFGNGGGMLPEENSQERLDDLQENPLIRFDQNGNDRLDQGDYLVFFGAQADAVFYDGTTGLLAHERNIYTDRVFYFFTPDRGTNKQAAQGGTTAPANLQVDEFDEYLYQELELNNLQRSGRSWFGEKLTRLNNRYALSFNVPNLVPTKPVRIASRFAARSINVSAVCNLSLNGVNIITHSINSVSGQYATTYARATAESASINTNSTNLNFEYNLQQAAAEGEAWHDYLTLNVRRRLVVPTVFSSFRELSSVGTGNVTEFSLSGSNANLRLWNVSTPHQATEIPLISNAGAVAFKTETETVQHFIAFDPTAVIAQPELIGQVTNQNLHGIGNPDLIVLSPAEFWSASQEIANFHQQNDDMDAAVVDIQQVYNEFASGAPDITAIRDFMVMLYEKAGTDVDKLPRYLLLMGDGSYDYKDRITDNLNFIPTYQSPSSLSPTSTFTSDDYFGFLDESEGGSITDNNDLLDVAIGRFPVNSEAEAFAMIDKIKMYVSEESLDGWRNTITYVADDEDNNIHLNDADRIAETIAQNYPEYNIDKIYLDAFQQLNTSAGDRYPDVNSAIENSLFKGALIFNYTGHGGVNNWAHERIFDVNDILSLENFQKLPLFVTATCEFSRYDNPEKTSAGELLVTNPNGGSIAMLTTVRLVFSNSNYLLNRSFFEQVFEPYDGRNPTLGEVILRTKNNISGDANNRKFALLGDPALSLGYARNEVVTTEVNGTAVGQGLDTLNALSEVTISGEVRQNGQIMSDFNGQVFPVIFDKLSEIKTLKNDPQSNERSFNLRKNVIYKGKASVVNGAFSFSFIVPKDIDYSFGQGKISYYAKDGIIDANGYTDEIVIGGASGNFGSDNQGPEVELFMNDENFLFGGFTNASPLLMVKLRDDSGINTTGTGIGHDIVATIDGDLQTRVILNDFYEAELDNFRSGLVLYPLDELPEGRHSIKVKAWDVHNNSGEGYTEFVVGNDEKFRIKNVSNYPNPFRTNTNFQFDHNRPGEEMHIQVDLFTLSGQHVASQNYEMTSEGSRVKDLPWNATSSFGSELSNGVYVYGLHVSTTSGEEARKFEKLIIVK